MNLKMKGEKKMKIETLVPAGRFMLCDVDSVPEFRGLSVVNFTVPAGVYYSVDESGREVFVGDYETYSAWGRVGLIPENVAFDAGYSDDDLSDDYYGLTFDEPTVCYFDLENGSFAFGSVVFEPSYPETE